MLGNHDVVSDHVPVNMSMWCPRNILFYVLYSVIWTILAHNFDCMPIQKTGARLWLTQWLDGLSKKSNNFIYVVFYMQISQT